MWVQLLSEYWGLIGTFAIGVLYMIVHRGAAVSQAKKTAMALMLAAEKRAEPLILVTGPDKFEWVIDKGYDLMPAWLRMFIGKPAFRTIVQELFDATVRMAKQYVDERSASSGGTDGDVPSSPTGRAKPWMAAAPNPAMPVVPPMPPRTTVSDPARTDESAAPAAAPAAHEASAAPSEDGAPV